MSSDYLFMSGYMATTPLPNLKHISYEHLKKRYRYDFEDLKAIDHFYEGILDAFKSELLSLGVPEAISRFFFDNKSIESDNEVLNLIQEARIDYETLKKQKINKETYNSNLIEKYKVNINKPILYSFETYLYHNIETFLTDADEQSMCIAYIYLKIFSYRYIRAYLKSKVLKVEMPYEI